MRNSTAYRNRYNAASARTKKRVIPAAIKPVSEVRKDTWSSDEATHAYNRKRKVPEAMEPVLRAAKAKRDTQRLRWTTAVFFAYRFQKAINAGFNYKRRGETGGSIVIRHLSRHAMIDLQDGCKIDYAKVILSKGKLRNIDSFAAVMDEPGKLTLSWSDVGEAGHKEGGHKDAPDKLCLSFYNEDMDLANSIEQNINLADLRTELVLPFYFPGCRYHLWVFELSKGNRNSGNTFYISLEAQNLGVFEDWEAGS